MILATVLVTSITIASEFLINENPVYVTALANQWFPDIASDGTNSLVVWQDARAGANDIYAARVNQDGYVLDIAGIAVSTFDCDKRYPTIEWARSNYLVVWSDARNDTSDIYAARVTSEGIVLDEAGIAISNHIGFQGYPAIAFDGTNYLIVWQDEGRSNSSEIYGTRVTQQGIVLDTNGFLIVAATSDQSKPAVAYDGSNFLVVWQDFRNSFFSDIYGTRVTSDGIVLDSGGFVISGDTNMQSNPALAIGRSASGHAEFLVVWDDSRINFMADLYGARVTSQGTVLDPEGILIAAMPDYQVYPDVTYDEENYLVVWWDAGGHGDIFATRVTSEGEILDPNGIVIRADGTTQMLPAITFNGTNSLPVWQDNREGVDDFNIYGTRVNHQGSVLDPNSILISTAASIQQLPKATFGENDFLIVWEEKRLGSDFDIYGARVNTQGTILDSISIAISNSANLQRLPSVAFNGRNFLTVWEEGTSRERDIKGTRLTNSGIVLDTTSIAISVAEMEQCNSAVISDNNYYLVVWQTWQSGSYYDIFGTRVTNDGIVLDPSGIEISAAQNYQTLPAVACDGTNFFVVWQDMRSSGYNIYGARVTPSGIVLDTAGIAICVAEGSQSSPKIAYDGSNFLVVWQDMRNNNPDIYGTRVSSTGTILDTAGIAICRSEGSHVSPAVVYDGINFLVVWQDNRNGKQDIYGARVTSQGIVMDSFPVTTLEQDQWIPALASGNNNEMLLLYYSWTGLEQNIPYNSLRIWGILSPVPGIQDRSVSSSSSLKSMPTIINNILYLPAANSDVQTSGELFDLTGRKVMKLVSGENNIHHLAPGIYFVRQKDKKHTIKVVIQR